MTDFDWPEIAQEVLRAVEVPTLATADADGTVRAVVVGGELKQRVFEWRSLPGRVHSKQVAKNPRIAFNFYDPKTSRAVYGAGMVERTEPDEDGFLRYFAKVDDLWIVIDEKVDGEYVEPQQLDPEGL